MIFVPKLKKMRRVILVKLNFDLPKDILLISLEELRAELRKMLAELKIQNDKEEIMTIKDTAEYLKVSVPTVRAMIANKEIPFFKRGQVIRLNRFDVQECMRKDQKQ